MVTAGRPAQTSSVATPRAGPGWRDLPFLGGDVSLDFVNTTGGRTKVRDHDRLRSFTDAISWARAAGLVDTGEQDALAERSEAQPVEAARALHALRDKRESLHAFLLAGARGSPGSAAARARVERWLRTTYRVAHLNEDFALQPAWHVDVRDVGLSLVSRRLALAAGRLLGSDSRSHISECGRCSWLFLDTSPSHYRRWCSMAICGNRAKAERHHRRSTPR
jgi:predicted RNA-binding Zn ribbon-like protein